MMLSAGKFVHALEREIVYSGRESGGNNHYNCCGARRTPAKLEEEEREPTDERTSTRTFTSVFSTT